MGNTSGVAASDIVRSMTRAGFSRDEIYDLLASVGLPGEQLQLIIDRVSGEFHDAKLEPQPSRLAKEVDRAFRDTIEELQHSMISRMDLLAHRLELVRNEIEKLVGQTARSRSRRFNARKSKK